MKIHKRKLLLTAGVLALLGAGCSHRGIDTPVRVQSNVPADVAVGAPTPAYTVPFRLGTQHLLVEVADTEARREQGLSGRAGMADNQAMVFDFRRSGENHPEFWMQDMKFGLDFVWTNQGRVTGVTPNIAPPANNGHPLPTYQAPGPVDLVLEVNAGWCASHQVKAGDPVSFE